MHPTFNSLTHTAGLEIIDPIETRRFVLLTSTPPTPTQTSTEGFTFSVAAACSIRTSSLTLLNAIRIDVRKPDGTHVASVSPPETHTFSTDEYLLELHAPLKVYIRVTGAFEIDADTDCVRIQFDDPTSIRIGTRSYHSSPATTITVPDDPKAVMEAVSTFASAIKTTSPERAWPTLRGHPPRLERGPELLIPDSVEPPETGITILVPPKYETLYPVVPVAYYLGSTIRLTTEAQARVTTETGLSHPLGESYGEIRKEAEQLLKRVFALDCAVRTEGYYPVALHERDIVEERTSLDIPALYDTSLSDRLQAYLSVSNSVIEDLIPTWHRSTYTRPTAEALELLPYLVNDLSFVRIKKSGEIAATTTDDQQRIKDAVDSFMRRAESNEAFVRSMKTQNTAMRNGDGDDESEASNASDFSMYGVPEVKEYVSLPKADTLEQAWVGEGTPVHGAKLHQAAFAHPASDPANGVIEIIVVCNDEQMREEWDAVSEIYGNRDDLRVDVTCEFDVPVDEFRDILAEDTDVVHYIGHIDGRGFDCPDGILDATTLTEVGATTVLLNGCRSYDQGIAVIEAGANAAVASLGDVGNIGAIEVGETLARLLHYGFGIGSAMNIVKDHTSIGKDYLVLGDPSVTVVQNESGIPIIYKIHTASTGDGEEKTVDIEAQAYPTRAQGIGSIVQPYLPGINEYHVAVGTTGRTTTTRETLQQTLAGHSVPLNIEEELVWSELWFREN